MSPPANVPAVGQVAARIGRGGVVDCSSDKGSSASSGWAMATLVRAGRMTRPPAGGVEGCCQLIHTGGRPTAGISRPPRRRRVPARIWQSIIPKSLGSKTIAQMGGRPRASGARTSTRRKHAADRQTVQPADQFAFCVGFDRAGPAKFIQADIGIVHVVGRSRCRSGRGAMSSAQPAMTPPENPVEGRIMTCAQGSAERAGEAESGKSTMRGQAIPNGGPHRPHGKMPRSR